MDAETRKLVDPIIRKRWPSGRPKCPYCGDHKRQTFCYSKSMPSKDPQYLVFWCYHCNARYSNKTGTLMHHSFLPIWKWEKALEILKEKPKATIETLQKALGVSNITAIRLRKVIILGLSMHQGGEMVDNKHFRWLYLNADNRERQKKQRAIIKASAKRLRERKKLANSAASSQAQAISG